MCGTVPALAKDQQRHTTTATSRPRADEDLPWTHFARTRHLIRSDLFGVCPTALPLLSQPWKQLCEACDTGRRSEATQMGGFGPPDCLPTPPAKKPRVPLAEDEREHNKRSRQPCHPLGWQMPGMTMRVAHSTGSLPLNAFKIRCAIVR